MYDNELYDVLAILKIKMEKLENIYHKTKRKDNKILILREMMYIQKQIDKIEQYLYK